VNGLAVALGVFLQGPLEPRGKPNEVPSEEAQIFYNARLSLRSGKSSEALKLWLLHNSLRDATGVLGDDEADFRSVVWAAMGNLTLCQDGFVRDEGDGAGLWPLALHNWLISTAAKGDPAERENPFDTFEAGRQERFVSARDVLSAEELRSVSFQRSAVCMLPELVRFETEGLPPLDFRDRLSTGSLMRFLLERSLTTLAPAKVRSLAVIKARLFDLDLVLAQLRRQKARRAGRQAEETARAAGVSAEGAREARNTVDVVPENSPEAAFLREALTWPAEDWMSLGRPRRSFLFAQARPFAADAEATERLVLSIIDVLIERRQGDEVEAWFGSFEALRPTKPRAVLFEGERGLRLLELDRASGFRERAVIALHRGVSFLEQGKRQEALSSFAYALSKSEESKDASVALALSRRWLSYTLAQYETNEQVVATLRTLVPVREFNTVIEDLVWRAALHADEASFERLVANTRRGSSLDARIANLRYLAKGNAGGLATQLLAVSEEEPHFVLRFVRQYLEKIEAEDADVRRSNVAMLKAVAKVLGALGEAILGRGSQARAVTELGGRTQALLDGLGAFDDSVKGLARGASPRRETFAGNIRLAPVDELPWPFPPPEATAPQVFVPLVLEPVEWRGAGDRLVFGWRFSE
jgi:hypothetical protein